MREERIETDGIPAKLYDPGDARGLLLLGHKKRLMFWEGGHVGLPAESIRQSVEFVNKYTA